MNKELIKEIIKNHEDSYPQIIKAYHKEIYNFVNETFKGNKFSEKLYRWLNEEVEFGKCGKETKFKSFIVGFSRF